MDSYCLIPTENVLRGVDFHYKDVYEPEFFNPIPTWRAAETYSIQLKFDDADYTKDIFYFCHVRLFTYMFYESLFWSNL